MRINLTAAAQLSRFAVRHWKERGAAGRIVHVASRAGHRGDSPAHWHYAASKGGMLAMHKTIARQYAHQGILSFPGSMRKRALPVRVMVRAERSAFRRSALKVPAGMAPSTPPEPTSCLFARSSDTPRATMR